MKTEHDILTEFYRIIEGSALCKMAGGRVIKSPDTRDVNSPTDDITISVLASHIGQIQEADLNINVYVHDEYDGGRAVPSPKVRALERASLDLLSRIARCDYLAVLESQHVYKVQGVDQHCINNRIYYRSNN